MNSKYNTNMDKVPDIFKSKKAYTLLMWFSAASVVFFVCFSVYLFVYGRSVWAALFFLMWASFSANNFRVSLKKYKKAK